MELIDEHVSAGVCNTPDYKLLETEIVNTVLSCDEHIKNVYYSEKILDRIESRMNFNTSPDSKVIYRDHSYLINLTDRLEANMLFRSA